MSYDLVVVSSYPLPGQIHGQSTVGVASYTKNTLTSLPAHLKILVLAEKLPQQLDSYSEKNITVHRCWTRNNFSLYFNLLKEILTLPVSTVLLEFEMAMFGNPIINIFLPFFLFILKLKGKKITIVLHQVVLDFNQMSGQIGQSSASFTGKTLNLLAPIFYQMVGLLSSQIIVFEKFLKDRLSFLVDPQKIIIIPHGVETATAKIGLNDHRNNFTVTLFGYLAWYKGTDWLVKSFVNYFHHYPQSSFRLVIAGGPNPNHLDKPYYKKFLAYLSELASEFPHKIILTGFVDESKIVDFYKQSDLIIFPYRAGMSSSGPLSLAFTHAKPFIVSAPIAPLFQTADITNILHQNKIQLSQISFNLTPKSLFSRIIYLKKHPILRKHLVTAANQIAESRNWSSIAKLYQTALSL